MESHKLVMLEGKLMKKAFLNKMKVQLEAERKDILKSIEEAKKSEIDVSGDDIDRIQSQIISRAASQLAARNETRVVQITAALKRISDGVYGVCQQCEEDIAEKRLSINPSFIICISCSEMAEIMKRRGY